MIKADTASNKGDNYRKRYPLAKITNAAYKRLLARVDRQSIKLDILKARIEDLEETVAPSGTGRRSRI